MAPRGTNTGEPIAAGGRDRRGHRLPRRRLVLPRPRAARRRRLVHARLPQRADGRPDRHGATPTSACPTTGSAGRWPKAPERIPSWFVFDSREGGRLPAIAMPEGDPAEHLAAGTWVRADTLDELAERDRRTRRRAGRRPSSGSTASARPASTRTSAAARTSTTRSSPAATGPNKALTPCDQPPYFAARFVLSDLGTKGGLVTDAAGRVLREDGSAIAGPLRRRQPRRLGLRRASTPARAPRSARRWSSPRWPCGTCDSGRRAPMPASRATSEAGDAQHPAVVSAPVQRPATPRTGSSRGSHDRAGPAG